MSVRTLLWVSGFLTLIAVGIPESVSIAFFLLIVPGLILALAPTVFVYTATFAIVRRSLRRYLRITRAFAHNLIAALITLGLSVLVTLPMGLAGRSAFHTAATGNVVPHDRVVIAGNVLLNNNQTPTENTTGKPPVPCEALCAALLDTPGVSTVTIAGTDYRGKPVEPISYRLVPKGEASSNALAPKSPEEILRYLPEQPASSSRGDYLAETAARKARENAITARWGLQLASEVTLSIVPSPQHHDLTITITFPDPHGGNDVAVKQAEVRDRAGRVLLRRQHVLATPVFVPLVLWPFALIPNQSWASSWRLVRSELQTGDSGIKPITVLFEQTTLARPPEPGDAVTAMRERLAAALMQPGAPADLALVAPWLATINWRSLKDGDTELLGKLIADVRVIDLPRLYEGADKSAFLPHRGVIVARLLNPATPRELRFRLDDLLRSMPPGTFAVPTPDELALLRDQPLRLNAPGLVERLADQGKAGVPELVRILQEVVREPSWAKWNWVIEAVHRALIRLGPDAAGALPVVIELFDQPDTPLAYNSNERSGWRITMARMGRPVGDLPFPPNYTAAEIARERSDIMQAMKRARDDPWWAEPRL
jgi:hypothetical protein